jgi:hypothetical protein
MAPAPIINPALLEAARSQDSLIVFPHAQRTGGKALRDQVLCEAYGAECVYSASRGTGSKSWEEVTAAELAPFRVYTGPSNFADLDKGRPTVFLALLRHPLYRAVSLYHYCRKLTGHRLHDMAMRSTLEEFYPQASRTNPPYFRNTQCLRISGTTDARRAQETILGKYLGFGFSADVEGFGNALQGALGWDAALNCKPSRDEARYDDQITSKFRDQVLSESAEDLKLFEWAAAGAPALAPRRSLFSALGSALNRRRD